MGQLRRGNRCSTLAPTPWVVHTVLALPCVLLAFPALAATRQTPEKIARKACLSGDYEKGVAILSDLFVETKDPTWIFNQARCFEQNRRYEEALARFQEYLRAAPDLSAADRQLTVKHIADCQELLAKQSGRSPSSPLAVAESAPVPQPAPPPVPQPAPPAVVPAAPSPTPAVTVVQPAEPVHPGAAPGAGLRVAGVATASVGVAALVAGVVLNLKVNSMASDLEGLGQYSGGKESDRKTYETLGWIGYGAGAACIATGAILYYLGSRSGSHAASTIAFVPILAPHQAAAAIGGRF
jgi:hypothetical protein